MALIKQTSHDKITVSLEEILDRDNMFNALNRVEKNKGCPGVDNLSTSELRSYLKEKNILSQHISISDEKNIATAFVVLET